MRKLHIPLLILAITVPMVSGNSSWAANKNNTSTDSNGCHQPGSVNCVEWCENHNKTDKSVGICQTNCANYWCNPNNPNPSTAGSPDKGKGTTAIPVNTGKPVEAPPPKGSNPTNAEPINSVKPDQPLPHGGGGGGRLK